MMGMIKANDGLSTAWILAICFAVLFMIAITIQDLRQSRKLTELEHRIEMINAGQKAQEQEDRIKTYESMTERLIKMNAKLDALERQRKEIER